MKAFLWALACASLIASASSSILGVEFGGDMVTVDQFKSSRPPQNSSGGNAAVDSSGWPSEDFRVTVFDLRPAFAWAPPEDDPMHRGPYLAGTWQLGFNGKADVSDIDGNFRVDTDSMSYNEGDNWSSVNLTLPTQGYKPEHNLLVLNFSSTQRSPSSPIGSGVTNIVLVQPNHTFAEATMDGAFFSSMLRDALGEVKNLKHSRFMGMLGTNYQAGYYGVPGHGLISWDQRSLPTDPSWAYSIRKNPQDSAIPWEYVVKYANTFNHDVWINVPVSATSGCMPVPAGDSCWSSSSTSYVAQLAQFLKQGLPSSTSIYVEHSNEVWNFGFSQYIYNKLNAIDVCNQTKNANPICSVPCDSKNPNDTSPCANQETLAQRRHLQRVYEIVREFGEVFGESEIGNRIRGIYAEWTIFPDHYNETLTWFEQAYGKGAAAKYLWGVASTSYFDFNVTAAGPDTLPSDATVKQVVDGYLNQSSAVPDDQQQIKAIAESFGLKLTAYEGGPGAKVGDKVDLANRINAHRDPEMQTVMQRYWEVYSQTYDVLHQFSLAGEYSRYGCWGAADFFYDRHTQPKWIGLTEMGG